MPSNHIHTNVLLAVILVGCSSATITNPSAGVGGNGTSPNGGNSATSAGASSSSAGNSNNVGGITSANTGGKNNAGSSATANTGGIVTSGGGVTATGGTGNATGGILSFKYLKAGDLQKIFLQQQIVSIVVDN